MQKYIIFGSKQFGIYALYVLGKENIEYFCDEQEVGGKIYEKEIIDLNTFLQVYDKKIHTLVIAIENPQKKNRTLQLLMEHKIQYILIDDLELSREKFLEINKKFWKKHRKNIVQEGRLLLSNDVLPLMAHGEGIITFILNQARGYIPYCLTGKNYEVISTYVSSAKRVRCKLNCLELIKICFISLIKYIQALYKGDVLSFIYKGIYYGDLLYDDYLRKFSVGTMKTVDWKCFLLVIRYIARHEYVEKVFKKEKINAVLTSDRVGSFAVLRRIALSKKYPTFSFCGDPGRTIALATSLEEDRREYEPVCGEIGRLLCLSEKEFEDLFQKTHQRHINGNGSLDAKYAFNNENKLYIRKEDFVKRYGLDPQKKNIFIMLHAFTDWPRSSDGKMVFRDYEEWFKETLMFALKDKSVNWIFKRHPSDEFYPTTDIHYSELFSNCPTNILYFSNKDRLDTRTVINVADAIITCIGSAGFEIPACAGTPSILAGHSWYSSIGFTINADTKENYFDILKNLSIVRKLGLDKIKLAKACYIYMYSQAIPPMHALPRVSFEEQLGEKAKYMDQWYWKRVIFNYIKYEQDIIKENEEYIKQVGKSQFKSLRKLF